MFVPAVIVAEILNSTVVSWALYLCVAFAVISTVRNFSADPHPSAFVLALLLPTLLPLLVASVGDMPIVRLSEIRAYFHKDEWILRALLVVSVQVISIWIISLLGSRGVGLLNPIYARPRSSRKALLFCISGMVITSILSNRTQTIFAGSYGEEGFYLGSGWFGGWPLLFVVFSAGYVMCSGMRRRFDYFIFYSVLTYWILHGNRSEVLLQAFLPLLMLMYRHGRRAAVSGEEGEPFPIFRTRRAVLVVPLVLLTLLSFQFVGLFRDSGSIRGALELHTQSSDARGITIATVGPSVYTLVAAIGIMDDESDNYLMGTSYLNYLYRTFPSALGLFPTRQNDLADRFIADADAIGGVHFAAEAYMNGGLVGAAMFACLVAVALNWILGRARGDSLMLLFLISIIFYLPRFVWYGNIYMYKLCLLFGFLFSIRFFLRKFSAA